MTWGKHIWSHEQLYFVLATTAASTKYYSHKVDNQSEIHWKKQKTDFCFLKRQNPTETGINLVYITELFPNICNQSTAQLCITENTQLGILAI